MWDAPESTIKSELGEGEHLLWAGQPRQGVVFRSSALFMIPFSLFWGGFAIVWEAMALGIFFRTFFSDEPGPTVFAVIIPLFGIPFVVIGLYLIFGRFFIDSKRRAYTFYGVTDQRIIIVFDRGTRKLKSLNLRTLSDLLLSEKSDGSGTITFGPTNPMAFWFGNMSWQLWGGMSEVMPVFEIIPDAKRTYGLIRQVQ
jgi:hypothetical protein